MRHNELMAAFANILMVHMKEGGRLLLLLVRLHDQSSSCDEVGGLLHVLQAPI